MIAEPTKSWAIYGELHEGGEAQYYSFNISSGERIHISLFKPANADNREFLPGFALIGPGLNSNGTVPDYLEIPAATSIIVVTGMQPALATYEPFSPSSFYQLAELDITANVSSTYYIAVFEPNKGGQYGLALGDRETYSIEEWILIPVKLISLYRWEGQSLAIIFSPVVATLIIGMGLLNWWKKWIPRTLFGWTAILSGLLITSTGVGVIFQMVLTLTQTKMKTPSITEIAITVILALIAILLGITVIRIAVKSQGKINNKRRAYLAILGILALFSWAGLLIGPVLAVLASVVPDRGVSVSQKPQS